MTAVAESGSPAAAPVAFAGPVLAVVPIRGGLLPAGGAETVAEAGGRGILVGDGTSAAAESLTGSGAVHLAEWGQYAPARWAAALAPVVASVAVVILPGSADGRDLAPRLAHLLGRPLLAGAVSVTPSLVVVARQQGRLTETHHVRGPIVATLLPGVRGVETLAERPVLSDLPIGTRREDPGDPEVLEVLPPDPATMDLSEATRVLAGGAGLGHPDRFALLAKVAAGLGATPGATRVVADSGWVPAHHYIGTTGVSINPSLYIAIGVSGAVQHVTGIGHPHHIIAVNTDPSAPMMALADLAIVAYGPQLLAELAARLGARSPSGGDDPQS